MPANWFLTSPMTFIVNVGPNTEKSIPNSHKSPLSLMGTRIANNLVTAPTSNHDFIVTARQF